MPKQTKKKQSKTSSAAGKKVTRSASTAGRARAKPAQTTASRPSKKQIRQERPSAARKVSKGSSSTIGKYVYCIIETGSPVEFATHGIGAEATAVHTVNYKNIAAVVSDTPIEVYDPTRENVLAHEGVNELVMRDYTVIPMSFGTVFKTRDDIIELLRSAYDAFQDVLVKMRGKFEFGLKVLWDSEKVIGELERENDSLRRLKEELSTREGSTYFARVQYGRLVDALLQERSGLLVSQIVEELRDVSVAFRANKPIGDRMIMNGAFLVTREHEAAFDAKVREVASKLEHLTFRYTGPWPPYNFVNIRLKLERAQEA